MCYEVGYSSRKIYWKTYNKFSYRTNDISCTPARGHAPQRENLEKNMQLAMCFLLYIMIRF